MAQEDKPKRLIRVGSTRLQISYDLQVGDVIERAEAPTTGFAQNESASPFPRLNERRFIDINPDNFASVFQCIDPLLEGISGEEASGGIDNDGAEWDQQRKGSASES